MKLNEGTIFSALVTALVGALLLLSAFETWALFTDHEPITAYVRSAVQTFPGWAFVIAVAVGAVLGHFLWGPATGIMSPRPRRDRARHREERYARET